MSSPAIESSTKRKSITLLDGGISRELIRIKAPFQQPEWSAYSLIHSPQSVQQIHEEFASAGADVLTTDSYALVPFHIGEERFKASGKELADLSGRLAKAAADKVGEQEGRTVRVAGSLPPVFGSYRPDLFDAGRVQDYLSVLVEGLAPHIDVWLGETLGLIAEAKAVVEAIRGTSKPLWIAFTIDDRHEKPGGKAVLRGGESPVEAATWAVNAGVDSLLFNCSRPEYMLQAVRDARQVVAQNGSDMQIGVYANAFVEQDDTYKANEGVSQTREDLDARKYVEFVKMWIDEGATIIGGCCGIGCSHIRVIAEEIRSEPPKL